MSSPGPGPEASARTCLVVLVATLACGAAGAQEPGVHPNPRYIVAPIPPSFTIAVDAAAASMPFALSSTVRAAFGSEGDAEADFIGDITAGLLLPSGDIVVLDDRRSELRIFDASGGPKQRLGGAGRGPGEFSDPLSLTTDGRGRLYVADLAHAVQVFEPGPGGYRYAATWRIDLSARAMCLLDTLLVVQGMVTGREETIHLYDRSGRSVRSFGALYRSPIAILNSEFSRGRVACDPQTNLIVYVSGGAIGEARAYRLDGSLVWRTAFTGLQANRVTEESGGYSVSTNPGGNHVVRSLTLVPGRGVVVQIALRRSSRDGAVYAAAHSFLLDAATGRPQPLGTGLPLIVAASDREALLAFDDPVPRFEVRGFRER